MFTTALRNHIRCNIIWERGGVKDVIAECWKQVNWTGLAARYTEKRWTCEIVELYLRDHHHHHVVPLARISLTLSRHFSLSFIASGRSSGLHLVSSHICCMNVLAGRPAFARSYMGVHRSTSLMSSSPLLQQCPACLVRLRKTSTTKRRWKLSSDSGQHGEEGQDRHRNRSALRKASDDFANSIWPLKGKIFLNSVKTSIRPQIRNTPWAANSIFYIFF